MDVAAQRGHAGGEALAVGEELAGARVPPLHKTIVEVDVHVAELRQAEPGHRVGGAHDHALVHRGDAGAAREVVPAVPPASSDMVKGGRLGKGGAQGAVRGRYLRKRRQ